MKNIFLLGELNQNELSLEYKNADVFVLPSYSDPSPLAVVEALFSGLPLLLSNRCGNHFEALVEGENGFVFDPFDKADIVTSFQKLINNRSSWQFYGSRSIQIADTNFNHESTCHALIDSFIHR
jgi:glycosyltransferase involved in cell wall biosynthesis